MIVPNKFNNYELKHIFGSELAANVFENFYSNHLIFIVPVIVEVCDLSKTL